MSSKGVVLRHMPQNRLAKLINRSGGVGRDVAVAEASRLVEEMRDPAMEAVDNMIGELEVVALDDSLTDAARLAKIELLADRLINLAETFALAALTDATKRLFDLAHGFATRGAFYPLPIAVNIRAIRLFGPRSPKLEDADVANVLLELRRVLTHFDIEVGEVTPSPV